MPLTSDAAGGQSCPLARGYPRSTPGDRSIGHVAGTTSLRLLAACQLGADGEPRLCADTVWVTEVGVELVALHPVPRLCADTVWVTEVGVDLHGRPVCQQAATVMKDDAGRGVHVNFVGSQDHLRDDAAQMTPVWL